MRLNWACAAQGETVDRYEVTVTTNGKVALAEEGGSQQIVGDRSKVHELYRLTSWMVESALTQDGKVIVTLLPRGTSRRQLDLAFEGGTVQEVSIAARVARSMQVKTFLSVTSVTINPRDVVYVNCAGVPAGTELTPEPVTAPVTPPAPVQPPAPQPSGVSAEELAAAQRDLAEAQQALAAERTAREAAERQRDANAGIITQLQAQLTTERQRASSLQGVAVSNLDTAVANARATRDALAQALQDKLDQIDTIQREVDDLTQRDAEAQARITELGEERERLEPLVEAHTLDVGQASAELEELRARYGANDETSRLMQTDEFLVGNTVRKTLDKVTKELKSIERRIGVIITYRETFLDAVRDARMHGDGSLPLNEDLERGYDGDGGEPEAQDQES